ncbi:7-cyano-7-deazaguanine synthase [Sphingomonas sp. LaA6.9]|uniref:7-cyano-7-deazaguanine synthase n=1 Tax=Sphingomonas sp. LaA6.9 TaxID=2919914 RepID=UPI001F4FEDF5|nr:7-cyano-7-deazaguanine synthase [Sphingomonas sp. LaA6.9]MCJ8157083.1 7-cyano-7-deazaguanine synthase [Sphingomonas sp. LaA6.9]
MNESSKVFERDLIILEAGQAAPRRGPKGRVYATIGSEIKCDKDVFDSYCHEGWSNIHNDLLIVCAAVELADRRWARGSVHWARHFHVTIPVIELTTWQDAAVQQGLCDTLRHLTGDRWRFSFVRHEGAATSKPRQGPLFPNQKKAFAIAYSEGLDSLSVSGLYNENDTAVSVRVSKFKQRLRKNERPFDRLPFDVKVQPNAEDSARSRGFKFAAVTAIASQLSNVSRIIVPESSQGALGPVLLPLLNIYPDYRNHPTFFRKMERFIKALLGVDLTYEQPRLWHTKGQTIAAFLAMPGIVAQQVIDTRSCWQQRFNVRVAGEVRHCGVCAACLLRRMSLHAAGVEEPSDKYAIADLHAARFSDALPRQGGFRATSTLYDYGYMGARHLQQLADLASLPDAALKAHAFQIAEAIEASVDDVTSKLREVLLQHSREWIAFEQHQGKSSFLKLWTKGGRHG